MDQLSLAVRKANKEHRCDWCNGIIKKGERYENQCNKDGGELYTWKNHLRCMELYEKLDMRGGDNGDGIGSDSFMTTLNYFLIDEGYEDVDYDEMVDKCLKILKSRED